jgi:predicted DNA-binding transcriptional regulator YafY
MRADRLLSILMILQSRGRLTAQELAQELEVSERTIYRDVNALSYSGVPVYAERGPGGGIALVERYRSDLTGLTREEVRALFMLKIPPALTELGLDQELRTAMLKLSAALPSTFRSDEQRVRQRIYIDPIPWKYDDGKSPPDHLQGLQAAVWESLELELCHHTFVPMGIGPVYSIAWPLGLVAKAEHWYLVTMRSSYRVVLRVDQIQAIQRTGKIFERPADFDLAQFWEEWCRYHKHNRPTFPVLLRVSPEIFTNLDYFFREGILGVGEPEGDGWVRVEVEFEYHEQARSRLLSFGGSIEVLEPVALLYSVTDYAQQILETHNLRAP